ncbi:MAG: M12 family metallo-peptidase, partial [Bacteroidota bacterium]
MQRQLLLLVIFILSVSVSFSQHHPISQQLQQLKQRQSATVFCPLVAPKSIAAAAHIQKMLKKATLLHMDDNQWNDMRQMSAELVEIEIPIDTHSSIVLELFKKNIFSPKWQYKNKDGQPLSIQKGLHYRGIVQGDPSSIVAISLVGKKLMGLISSPVLGNLVIGQLNDGSERYILYKDSDRYEQNPMNCHADLLPTDATTVLHPHAQYSKSSCGKVIDIYFEADHVFYQAAGNSEQNVINYLAGLFNIVATLFQRESIAVRISEVKVWTTPDPYPTSRADDALIKFRETLNGSFNGDAAQLLSLYRDENGVTSNGGLAFIDQLCNNKALSVGYSNIDGGYNLLPAYSWDVFLVTHEFGHTFGSPHTHACKWGPDGTQSLDNCFETEGNCSPGPTPTTGGTIMSYCHLTTQGIDMSNGFGEVPGDLIRNRVATASCLAIGSDDFTASINTMGETVLASGDTLLLFASPDDNSYVYQWYKNDERLDDAVQAFYRASTPGEYAVEISRNGCTERAAITVEEQTLAVNFSCVPSNCTTCIGKSIVIDAGVEATNYNWSTGENTRQIEVFGAGDYTVTVTRSGDSATATTSVQFTQLSRTDEVDICEGETYAVGNSTYTTSGTYTDILTTADGCREEVTTVLTVYPTDESFDIITICQGESIRVGDSVYTESGNYTNTVTDENGCESRINTMLTVAPTYRTDQQVSICEGGEHVVGNNAYTVAGTYEITLTSSDNCDSTIVLQLAVAENYRIEQSIQRCEGEQITVGNNIYTTTGVYEDMLIASDGCDSLVITDLVVYPHQEQFISRVICAGEQVQIGSSIYTSTGQYEDILTSAQGCDSIIQTQVTVLPSSTTQQTFDGCEGDQITVGNSTYDTSGTYTDILTAVNGCDSTVTTQVIISDEIRVEEQLDLCYGA